MAEVGVRVLQSADELRDYASPWNELYARSEPTPPTSRAELVALWYRHFAAARPLSAYVVEHRGRPIAALPLIERRRWGQRIGELPGNDWSSAGDFLIDPACESNAACDALVAALTAGGLGLLDFRSVAAAAPRWQALLAAFGRARLPFVRRKRFRIGTVDVTGDWQCYFTSRSRNHRRAVRRALARAGRTGALRLVCHDRLTSEQVEPLLRACFEIEAAGWKGEAGGAVLNVPAVWQFYLEQARQLAAAGCLNLVVLEHAGGPIAFEYGWLDRGVYSTPKVGYDEAFARVAPGQLLRALLLERLMNDDRVHTVDFLGPLSPATASWATHDYGIERVVVGVSGAAGRAAVEVYRGGWSLIDRMRRLRTASAPAIRPLPDAAGQPGDEPVDVPAEIA